MAETPRGYCRHRSLPSSQLVQETSIPASRHSREGLLCNRRYVSKVSTETCEIEQGAPSTVCLPCEESQTGSSEATAPRLRLKRRRATYNSSALQAWLSCGCALSEQASHSAQLFDHSLRDHPSMRQSTARRMRIRRCITMCGVLNFTARRLAVLYHTRIERVHTTQARGEV